MRKMPAQKPGRSKQDYETPREFIDAVEKRFGRVTLDLAATKENKKSERFWTTGADSLSFLWSSSFRRGDVGWLNPPYSKISPWAEKCSRESLSLVPGAIILLLVPAAVGSHWFERHVFGRASVFFLKPRISFVGTDGSYPKDLMLCRYASDFITDVQIWEWK